MFVPGRCSLRACPLGCSADDTAGAQLATPWSAILRAVWTATMSLVRLYLSSFRTGQHPERLLGLAGVGRRTALVPNALDGLDEQVRAAGLDRDLHDLDRKSTRLNSSH